MTVTVQDMNQKHQYRTIYTLQKEKEKNRQLKQQFNYYYYTFKRINYKINNRTSNTSRITPTFTVLRTAISRSAKNVS